MRFGPRTISYQHLPDASCNLRHLCCLHIGVTAQLLQKPDEMRTIAIRIKNARRANPQVVIGYHPPSL